MDFELSYGVLVSQYFCARLHTFPPFFYIKLRFFIFLMLLFAVTTYNYSLFKNADLLA